LKQFEEERKIKIGDKEVVVPLGELELKPNPSEYVAEVLVEQGVDVAFGVHGGDVWQLADEMSNAGIKLITFRHEQNAVYAAEAYSKVRRRPGIVYVDMGPGLANAVPALHQAWISRSPIILLAGGSIEEQDYLWATIQESHSTELLHSICKWTCRVTHTNQVKQFLTRAFKIAMTYPYGPVSVELTFSLKIKKRERGKVYHTDGFFGVFGEHHLYIPSWLGNRTKENPRTGGGDPELIEEAVKKIYESKGPIIFAGDGVHWANAGPEIQRFCELAQVPISGRRLGRGCIPEDHPLHFRARAIRPIGDAIDLVVIVGHKVGFFDGWGSNWKRVIQINESTEHIATWLPTETLIIGNPKLVFRQMIEYVEKHNLKPPPERKEFIKLVQKAEKEQEQRLHERAEKYKDNKPIHYGWLAKVVWDVCEERYGGRNYIIQDGYTISYYSPQFVKARFSGQCMDAAEHAGVGHGIGMAIGICFADPDYVKKYPVVVMMGDAGMGNAGMEIETAQRYNLPIVYIVTNNDGWLTGCKYIAWSISKGEKYDALGPQDQTHPYGHTEFINNLRYDKLSEVIPGVYGEWVTDPSELKSAINRGFNAAEAGHTTIINVDIDKRLVNPVQWTTPYAFCYAHIPWEKLPKTGKALRRLWCGTIAKMLTGKPVFDFEKWGIPDLPLPDPWDPQEAEP